MKAESDFHRNAVSSAGAEGLMQIMPETQEKLGVKDPFDPEENIAAGIRYLGELLQRYDSLRLALAAYNAGPTAVDRFEGIPPYEETEQYVERVLSYFIRFQSE